MRIFQKRSRKNIHHLLFLLSSFLLCLFFLISISVSNPENKPPVADARCGFSPDDVTQKYVYTTPGTTVYFDGSKSFDRDIGGRIREYYWDFGDGYTDIGAQVQHSFSGLGQHTVTLLVVDGDGSGSLVPSEVLVFINEGVKAKIKLPKKKKGFIQKEDNKIKFVGEASGGTPCYEVPHYKFTWKSDVIGVIGVEKEFFLPTTSLPLGWHHITLEVEDCLGNKANSSVDIAIVLPLEAKITELCEERTSGGQSITLGRVVFDSSWTRFIPHESLSEGIESCDNKNYTLNIAKWLEHDNNKNILIYTSGGEYSKTEQLKNFLEENDYSVTVIERTQQITESLLSSYGQVWFLDTNENTMLDDEEVNAIMKYHNNKGNILLSGESKEDEEYASYALMVNGISSKFDVEMKQKLNVPSSDDEHCVSPSFIIHKLTRDVEKISTSNNDLFINVKNNPKVEVIATIGNDDISYIAVLDYETIHSGTKTYSCNCEVKLTGKVSGGMPPYEVKWISLEDGVFDRFWINTSGGSYTVITTPPLLPPLSSRTHTIMFEVIDDLGFEASDIRYEVEIEGCCAFDTICKSYWPNHEGPLVMTTNERSHSCDIWEVCHPDLWQLAREAIECCKWQCKGRCHDKCGYAYSEGEKIGTTPEGLNLDGLKKCSGLYIIYGFGPAERYMTDYFWPEICCTGMDFCWPKGRVCCQQDLGKCRCSYHVYTKNQQGLPCTGSVSKSPVGWKSDVAMNKNSCTFSDLPAHVSILGDQGIVTNSQGINTGTCCDYSNALTTMLRIVGYKPNEAYSVRQPGHCYNLVKFPQDDKYHLIDTVGNCRGSFDEYNEPYVPGSVPQCIPGYNYCEYDITGEKACRNDNGLVDCPDKSQVYGC
jgi:PKD repeat protein